LIEQGYMHVKDKLGRANFQVRPDIAIRCRQALVQSNGYCRFSFFCP
jgi:hypothetical protein